MRVSTRFPIAVHALIMITAFSPYRKVNSDFISQSTGINAVIIRNIFTQLKKAGLISVSPGRGGTTPGKAPEQISLWDIYTTVEDERTDEIFKFHDNLSPHCPVGGNIYDLLYSHLDDAVKAMQNELSKVTIADLIAQLYKKVPDLPDPSVGPD